MTSVSYVSPEYRDHAERVLGARPRCSGRYTTGRDPPLRVHMASTHSSGRRARPAAPGRGLGQLGAPGAGR